MAIATALGLSVAQIRRSTEKFYGDAFDERFRNTFDCNNPAGTSYDIRVRCRNVADVFRKVTGT